MTQPEGQTARDIFPEDEGLPEVSQDDSPTMERAEDPEFAPLPGERPGASADFGTTSLEQAEGESLDGRLAREIPDDAPDVRGPAARLRSTRAGPGHHTSHGLRHRADRRRHRGDRGCAHRRRGPGGE